MATYEASIIHEGLGFGEAPRWHDGRLWFSDFYRHGVFSVDENGAGETLEVNVPGQPSGLGWLPDGSMLVVSMTDHRVLRVQGGATSPYADISEYCGFWANDMVVSESGVSYVGNFGFDLDVLLKEKGVEGLLASPPPTTNLVALSAEGAVLQSIPEMGFPNGSVITPNNKTLIVAETMPFRLSAFDIATNGTLTNRRIWAQLDFVPADGICLDAEGHVWVANALQPQCIRVREGGDITDEVTTSQTSFACMLGGDDRTSLYVMTAPSSDRFKIADKRLGRIEKAHVAVPGAGRP